MTGQKTWVVGEEVLAPDFNNFVQSQVVAQFANVAARDAWTSPPNGALCITTDTYTVWTRIAGVWVANGTAPGTELVYAQITGSITVATTVTIIINPNIQITYDGTPVIAEFYSYNAQLPASAGAQLLCNLWDNNTDLGLIAQYINPAAGLMGIPVLARRKFSPGAGTHNYHIRANVGTGSGLISASTTGPAYFRVTRA